MAKPTLTPIDVTQLEVYEAPFDLRRDLHALIAYIQNRTIKRATRTNQWPKAEAKRAAKLLSDPDAADDIDQDGYSAWLDFVDDVAYKMNFIQYDREGIYAGYSSAEPSYPDNYIEFNAEEYGGFLKSSLQRQEKRLFTAISGGATYQQNEFFRIWNSPFSRLNSFSQWGIATGVFPTLDFSKSRQFLIELLAQCDPNVWYSVESLIAYLKKEHSYFLIPKKPVAPKGRHPITSRYGNFKEGPNVWRGTDEIADDAPDAFERVEGRYVERFLEGVPLTMGYVSVAYSAKPYEGLYPEIGHLKAFRINERFLRLMNEQIAEPQITVQPNFEIYVESDLYPAGLLNQLSSLAELVSEDTITIMRLQRKKVAAHLAEDDNLDAVQFLTDLSQRELPRNVQVDLEEWAGHSDKFVLYDGYGLLEGNKRLPAAVPFTAEEIDGNLRIVHSPAKLFTALEEAELVPLSVRHLDARLRSIPKGARTIFRQKHKPAAKPKKKQSVALKRQTQVTLFFPDGKTLDAFNVALTSAGCVTERNTKELMLKYDVQIEEQVAKVLKELEKEYKIQIEDIGG
ncbi:hypothetical protein KFU94_67845 [Chloroflexi bacterium TSY]|nr:hypothetical protein [Chloroflexi bacterium TSY]